MIESRAAFLAERFEPRGIDEIGNQHVAYLVAELVVLACVTHFVCIEPARVVIFLYKGGEIDVGIAEHFQQLVAGGYGPLQAVLHIAFDEHFAERQPILGQVMIAKVARLIGIVEHDQPPIFGWRFLALGYEHEIGIDAPCGGEVSRHLGLQCRQHFFHVGVGQCGAGIDDSDLDISHAVLL